MNLLTKNQQAVISLLSQSPLKDKFYWTGGTLLAYHYLKHRRSLDVDFFSEVVFSFDEINPFVQQVRKRLGFKKTSYQKVFDRFEFLFENKESLRVEFVYYNREKKTLGKRGSLLGIKIDSIEDIAANKVMAYFDRNEPKDLFDLYFLLTKGDFSPQKLLELVEEKFGLKFDDGLLWSESFKGLPLLAEIKPLLLEKSEVEKDALLEQIKDYFRSRSEKFLQSLIR